MSAHPFTDASVQTSTSPDQLLRQAMRGIATSIVIVSTGNIDGERYAMTANSFTSVSLDPPTILVCINHQASVCEPINRFGRFCVNILDASQEALAQTCSKASTHARLSHHDWQFDETGLPYLHAAQAVLHCTVQQQLPLATHTVMFGKVSGGIAQHRANPLLYLNGQFLSVA